MPQTKKEKGSESKEEKPPPNKAFRRKPMLERAMSLALSTALVANPIFINTARGNSSMGGKIAGGQTANPMAQKAATEMKNLRKKVEEAINTLYSTIFDEERTSQTTQYLLTPTNLQQFLHVSDILRNAGGRSSDKLLHTLDLLNTFLRNLNNMSENLESAYVSLNSPLSTESLTGNLDQVKEQVANFNTNLINLARELNKEVDSFFNNPAIQGNGKLAQYSTPNKIEEIKRQLLTRMLAKYLPPKRAEILSGFLLLSVERGKRTQDLKAYINETLSDENLSPAIKTYLDGLKKYIDSLQQKRDLSEADKVERATSYLTNLFFEVTLKKESELKTEFVNYISSDPRVDGSYLVFFNQLSDSAQNALIYTFLQYFGKVGPFNGSRKRLNGIGKEEFKRLLSEHQNILFKMLELTEVVKNFPPAFQRKAIFSLFLPLMENYQTNSVRKQALVAINSYLQSYVALRSDYYGWNYLDTVAAKIADTHFSVLDLKREAIASDNYTLTITVPQNNPNYLTINIPQLDITFEVPKSVYDTGILNDINSLMPPGSVRNARPPTFSELVKKIRGRMLTVQITRPVLNRFIQKLYLDYSKLIPKDYPLEGPLNLVTSNLSVTGSAEVTAGPKTTTASGGGEVSYQRESPSSSLQGTFGGKVALETPASNSLVDTTLDYKGIAPDGHRYLSISNNLHVKKNTQPGISATKEIKASTMWRRILPNSTEGFAYIEVLNYERSDENAVQEDTTKKGTAIRVRYYKRTAEGDYVQASSVILRGEETKKYLDMLNNFGIRVRRSEPHDVGTLRLAGGTRSDTSKLKITDLDGMVVGVQTEGAVSALLSGAAQGSVGSGDAMGLIAAQYSPSNELFHRWTLGGGYTTDTSLYVGRLTGYSDVVESADGINSFKLSGDTLSFQAVYSDTFNMKAFIDLNQHISKNAENALSLD
ncbi:MAG: hypothetical protein D6769_01265, partial [Methanobacteriota archaeon]